MVTAAPYGSWSSPITPEMLVAGAASLGDVQVAGGATWWSELRPDEGGRVQVVRRHGDGPAADVLPDGFSARTRVHEYGGGAWWVHGNTLFFANWADQRLYRVEVDEVGAMPRPITPEPGQQHGLRYADGRVTEDGRWVVCVRERHEARPAGQGGADAAAGEASGAGGEEARNEVVAVPAEGGGLVHVLASGRDFVAAPRISRDGRQLAWLAWDHPGMPWDSTELWVGHLVEEPTSLELLDSRRVAGRPGESLVQPEWGRHGQLFVVSDRSSWWNVHRVDDVDELAPVSPVDAEVGQPAWVFGQARYAVARDGTIVLTYSADAAAHLVVVPEDGEPVDHLLPFVSIGALRAVDGTVTYLAHAAAQEPLVARSSLVAPADVTVLRPPRDLGLAPGLVARAQPMTFPTTGGAEAHAYYYAPCNPGFAAPDGERPPLLVLSHGGPTASASAAFNLAVQFWTSRGFAVVDVDYRGSTGYGRPYRDALREAWGIADVDDCCAAATSLVERGLVDPARLAIRGGSAGGFTTLAALSLRDVFRAGASHYGVTDLGALARDTHKFESRYLDGLVGRWPEAESVYAERSPINHTDGLDCPLIVLQGLEDEVVPPSQAEMLVAALEAKGIPHAYLAFPGEQHGFRQAASILRALTAELWFYGRVFGFRPAGEIEPIAIRFEERLG
ncbi:MAG: prolyl oligopeptidase family serine peptidase [Acidimicrobiia bacterium]|nr:prolyl oligopeptidase family serine peptidase [Acidimicrobiia bacterium]